MPAAVKLAGLKDAAGRPVVLGGELGRGGEGAVFEVQGAPGTAAKVYDPPKGADHGAKLVAMAALANDRLLKLAAWPTSVVLRGGQPVGFLMPRFSGFRPAFELYGPKLRLQQFPRADWRFLVRAASNTARAFNVVHAAGHVIGDVNHGNMIVGKDATVRLIDCDSFQVTQGGKAWLCEVGVGTHQPSEMQSGGSYRLRRTPNHDAFGLAVLVFQMLCMGRHPFSGRPLGPGDAPSIEEAIQHFRYAYSGDTRATRMAPPPGSLPMDALTPQIRQFFEQAFGRSGAQGGRPEAAQWIGALDDLAGKLRQCSASSSHYYLNSVGVCPWCEIEERSGTLLFPAVFVAGATGTDGFMLLWQQVASVQLPGPRPDMPVWPRVPPSPEARAVQRRMRSAWLAVSVALCGGWAALSQLAPDAWRVQAMIGLTCLLLLALSQVRGSSAQEIKRSLRTSRVEWRALRDEWAAPHPRDPANIRARLDRLKEEYDALVADRAARLAKLRANRRASQLTEYLDRFQIGQAKIKGIGPTKAATLQSYNIETAADVVERKVLAVPGCGPKTVQSLVAWRTTLERSFRFDPNREVSPAETDKVESAVAAKRKLLEQRLSAGLAELRAAVLHEQAIRERLQARFKVIAPLYGQAVADSRAVSVFS